MKNTYLSSIVFQVLKVIKNFKVQPPDLLFLFGLLAFTSAGIIFHKFLELLSKISDKIFAQTVPHKIFARIRSDPPTPTPVTPLTAKIG